MCVRFLKIGSFLHRSSGRPRSHANPPVSAQPLEFRDSRVCHYTGPLCNLPAPWGARWKFAGQPKASQGGCRLVGLVPPPPQAGTLPAVRGFCQVQRRGAGRKKSDGGSLSRLPWALTQSIPLQPPGPATPMVPQAPLFVLTPSSALGCWEAAGRAALQGLPGLCTRPVTGSRPGRSQGNPHQDRAGATPRPPPPGRHPSCLRGETGLSLPALVSRKLLTRAG